MLALQLAASQALYAAQAQSAQFCHRTYSISTALEARKQVNTKYSYGLTAVAGVLVLSVPYWWSASLAGSLQLSRIIKFNRSGGGCTGGVSGGEEASTALKFVLFRILMLLNSYFPGWRLRLDNVLRWREGLVIE